MQVYTLFLSTLCVLFVASAVVLLVTSAVQFAKQRGRRAAVYLGLTALAVVVAAGFYFFRRLI
jgi:hypothetical protein